MRKLVLLAVCSLVLFSCGKTKEELLEEEVYHLEEEISRSEEKITDLEKANQILKQVAIDLETENKILRKNQITSYEAEFDKDYTAREVLESRMIRLKGITEQVEDTKKLLDFDNYQAALSFYRSIKVLSEEDLPGTTNIVQDLKQFFPRSAKAKKENPNETPEKPSV